MVTIIRGFCSYVGLTRNIHISIKIELIEDIIKHGPVELMTTFDRLCMRLHRLTKVTGECELLVNSKNITESKSSVLVNQ